MDAVLATLTSFGVNLSSQRDALIAQYNAAGGGNAGRGQVMYRLADDNTATNPINNRPFVDAEYSRGFVLTQYFGYLRRNSDLPGLSFWLRVSTNFRYATPPGSLVWFAPSPRRRNTRNDLAPLSRVATPNAPNRGRKVEELS